MYMHVYVWVKGQYIMYIETLIKHMTKPYSRPIQ